MSIAKGYIERMYVMNKARRKGLEKAAELIEDARDLVEIAFDGECNSRDNLSDNMKDTEKYENSVFVCVTLEKVAENLDRLIKQLGDVIDK